MKHWKTKDGRKIPLEELEDSHLINIIKVVEKRAKELDGEIIIGGTGPHAEDFWADTGSEEDWLAKFGHWYLLKEKERRGL